MMGDSPVSVRPGKLTRSVPASARCLLESGQHTEAEPKRRVRAVLDAADDSTALHASRSAPDPELGHTETYAPRPEHQFDVVLEVGSEEGQFGTKKQVSVPRGKALDAPT
jgi:hypothetical protein